MSRFKRKTALYSIAAVAITSGFTALAYDGDAKSGIDRAHFDASVRPQDDFFRHVNGTWINTAKIPPDRSGDGAFFQLRDEAEANLRAIIEETVKTNPEPGTEARKIVDLYTDFMDEARAEKLGVEPVAPALAVINTISDKGGLLDAMASLGRNGVGGAFMAFAMPDQKKSDTMILSLNQGGIGLPDEAFYREPRYEKIRAGYRDHIAKTLELAGVADPAATAEKIVALETRLAKHHYDRVKGRDRTATYNKKTKAELEALAPGVDWTRYFTALGLPAIADVIVRQPEFFAAMAKSLDEVPLDDWKAWLTWNVLRAASPMLNKALADENFRFYSKTLNGVPEQRPRWKRAVEVVERSLGEALGKLYVAKHFPPAAKERMKVLVANLVEAYREDISSLDWMSAETRAKALDKLKKFTPKIGYPDKWRDYSKLEIKPGDLLGNVQRARAFELDRNFNKLGKPIDKTEWGMTPQTVNAYYNASFNEIVFPAAILQPPFFKMGADDAVNYGAIGAVIGHEIGHGFDDQGSKSDGDGNMINWWTDSDRKEFEKRAGALIAQYNAFEPAQLPGEHVNGALTIGENIGDLGGVSIGLKAYKRSLNGKEAPAIDGLTGAQRFFIGYAQAWRSILRDENLKQRLATDPHSPPEFRCNGVVRNVDEFYEAFGVKPGDKLFLPPDQRVRIW